MKRFFLLIVLVMVVSWMIASHRSPFRRSGGPSAHWAVERRGREGDAGHRHVAAETRRKTQRILAEARDEIREALDEAGDEVRQALDEVGDEVHQAIDEVRGSLASDDDEHMPCHRFLRLLPRLQRKPKDFPCRSCREPG